MRQPLNRPGYYLMGFSRYVRHSRSSRVIRPKTARAFPLWRKLDHPPCKQLSLLDLL